MVLAGRIDQEAPQETYMVKGSGMTDAQTLEGLGAGVILLQDVMGALLAVLCLPLWCLTGFQGATGRVS